MTIGSSTPESDRNLRPCPECGEGVEADLTLPPGSMPCPECGSLRWFVEALLDQVDGLQSEKIPAVVLDTHDKAQAIAELVSAVEQNEGIAAEEEAVIYEAIMKREQLGPTGIGRGFAFPHTRHSTCNQLAMAIGFCNEGIEFESLDGLPVHTIALLISPANDPGAHLRTLERISRNLRSMM